MKDIREKLARVPGVAVLRTGILVDSSRVLQVVDFLKQEQLIHRFSPEWEHRNGKLYSPLLDNEEEVDYEEYEVEDEYDLSLELLVVDVLEEVFDFYKSKELTDTTLMEIQNELEERLVGLFSDEVEEDLPDEVEEDLPDEVEEDLPDEVEEDLPDEVEEDLPDEVEDLTGELVSTLIQSLAGAGAYYRLFVEDEDGETKVKIQVDANDLSNEIKSRIDEELAEAGFSQYVGDWQLVFNETKNEEYWTKETNTHLKDSVKRTVEHGKKKVRVNTSNRKATPAQRRALEKARKKAHSPSARRSRRQSNDVRKRSGW